MLSQQEQATVQGVSDAMALNYILISGFALLAYDSLLTLCEEVPYIWITKWKLGTVLYLLARYTELLYIVIEMIVSFNSTSHRCIRTCNAMVRVDNTVSILPLIGVQGLLLARTYAVTDRKQLVLVVLGILGICAIVPELVQTVLDSCGATKAQINTFTILDDFGSIAVILFDIIVVVVTLTSTLGTWRVHKRSTWTRLTLAHLLAEQSLLRFGFMATMSVADAILSLILRPTLSSVLGPIQNSLAVIIICRFHLDLQKSIAHPNGSSSKPLPTSSIGSFRVAGQRRHDVVTTGFGSSLGDESVEAKATGNTIVNLDLGMSSGTTRDEIELAEIELAEARPRRQRTRIAYV